jgi:hypothetical protein
LDDGLAALEPLFDELLWATLPNAAALELTDRPPDAYGKRDILFALDVLGEGENEAILILTLARDALARDPQFDAAHLVREAWYYLRTGIDPHWQLDDGPPSAEAILAYVTTVLRERLDRLETNPPEYFSDPTPAAERAALLRRLRATPSSPAPPG